MTRVLQAIAGAPYGGAENFFVTLVLALNRAGLEQQVVMRRNAARAARLRQGGLAPVELRFGGAFDLWTPRACRREAARFRPDIVLTWMSRASRVFPRGEDVRIGRLGSYYDLKYFRKCDHLVGNTPDIVDYLVRQGWPPARAHCIPNFVAADEMPAPARESLATPGAAPLILAAGRLHEGKGFDVLLKALMQLPDSFLWLAGEGPERHRLAAMADELGIARRVRFLGWRDDMGALYGAADVCVVPSRAEAFGNVIVEAWAAGVPVVAATAKGPASLLRDGDDGVLVPIDDSAALAAALRQVIDDEVLYRRLAGAGRTRWRREFTEDVAVDRWRALFEAVLG